MLLLKGLGYLKILGQELSGKAIENTALPTFRHQSIFIASKFNTYDT
jgi:hypothetical protein